MSPQLGGGPIGYGGGGGHLCREALPRNHPSGSHLALFEMQKYKKADNCVSLVAGRHAFPLASVHSPGAVAGQPGFDREPASAGTAYTLASL